MVDKILSFRKLVVPHPCPPPHLVQIKELSCLLQGYRDFFGNLDQINYVTLTASVSAMLVLVLIRDGINNNKKHFPCMRVPIPIELLVVSFAKTRAWGWGCMHLQMGGGRLYNFVFMWIVL